MPLHVLPDMRDEASEKLDDLLTPIEVSVQTKTISEVKRPHVAWRRGPSDQAVGAMPFGFRSQ